MKLYLVTKQRDLNGFVNSADRLFFSFPVEVFVWACSLGTKKNHLLYVEEVGRHERYPVLPEDLRREYQLTRKQRSIAI